MPVLIEAAIDSPAAAERAVLEGSGRLEVCARLDLGGLTPPLELLRHGLSLGVPLVAMVRPRAGSFVYSGADVQQLMRDAAAMRDAGAHGVVFGMLTPDHTIDEEAVTALIRICSGIATVFHRAFDATPGAQAALETLIEWGVTRVLTSGHAKTAAEGAEALATLTEHATGRIQVLPGGGIRAHNVADIVRRTGVTQVHARGTEPGVIASIKQALEAM
jgi:copper homeostasis protein